jgi:hypothetical protein
MKQKNPEQHHPASGRHKKLTTAKIAGSKYRATGN